MKTDPRSTEALFRVLKDLALTESGRESDAYWELIHILHWRGTEEVFLGAEAWSLSAEVGVRIAAADILAQLEFHRKDPPYPFRDQTLPIFLRLLEDPEPEVMNATLIGFGHLGSEGQEAMIVRLADHPDESVRYGVAFALGGNDHPLAVKALIQLSRDESTRIRDWATFGFGAQGEADSEQIRQALLERTEDPDPNTQAEGIAGLAERGDRRVLPVLKRILESEEVGTLVVEAAGKLGDPELLPSLRILETWWEDDRNELADALAACATPPPADGTRS